ncbi:MAG: efflux transporter outer membrane subunit [Desulfobacterota bacterium]|jgi:multidrug efflux system outer membrane protein|nr:efflux transporter outer membrane subunit [Thermodesulfobacteriota bacterium]
MPKALFFALAGLLLVSCTVGPDYVKPTPDTPPTWRLEYEAAAGLADLAWWEGFGDPVLNNLIKEALTENKDLKIAAARVDQYLGALDTTRSQFFPQISGTAAVSRQKDTETGPTSFPAGVSPIYNTHQAYLSVSWEIDIWGRIRRATEAARADVLASEEGRRAVILSLATNVANGYLTLRALDRQLEIARETEKAYAETLRLFNLRYKYGTISRLELSQIESQYESARQAVPQYQLLIAQQENFLSTLIGRNPGPIPRGRTIDELAPVDIPAGLPSTLLERRPDILQSEQNLVAANARIGQAKALYFPTISLTGILGVASADLSKLFESGSTIWNAGAAAAGPIFTFGGISGQVKQAEAFQQQAFFQYLQTVQNAFREVEDALAGTLKGRERLAAQGRQVEALKSYARVARLQYEGGTANYFLVLDADRSLFNAQLSYVETQSSVFTSLINVYKSLGGGWVAEVDRRMVEAAEAGK